VWFIQSGGLGVQATVKSLGIDRLPREECLALVQAIWDTIAAEPQPPLLSEAQRQELARRVAEDNGAPDDVIPWEQVRAQTVVRL
jgi:putative addiction module component (TIGR02574 family)